MITDCTRPEFVYEATISGYGIKKRARKKNTFSSASHRAPRLEIDDKLRQAASEYLTKNFKWWRGVKIEVREMRTHDHGTIISTNDRTISEPVPDHQEQTK